jgi:hypothetical protein
MNRALSKKEVLMLAGINIPLITHRMFSKIKKLESLMIYPAILVLYEKVDHLGHWVCIIFHKKRKVIEFFDPYGLFPDTEQIFISKDMWISSFIARLFFNFITTNPDWKIEYNSERLQRIFPGIGTCGRWVGVRLRYRDIPLEEFVEYFRDKQNKDKIIVEFSDFLFSKLK